MTTIARIVEKFTMTLEGPAPDRDSWFLDYVLRDPKHAGIHLTAGWLALNSLKSVYTGADDISSAWESFGGMGAQALMVQRLFNIKPGHHFVGEYSTDAVNHLRRVLPSDVVVEERDAYGGTTPVADLVVLDFGDLTVWKTRDGEAHRALLDRVFSQDPKAVVFTDIACRYLHLHRDRYESLLGEKTCVGYASYLRALLTRFEVLYGYTLVEGYWDRWSAVMALVPSEVAPGRGSLQETPPSPTGLELL